MLNNHDFTDPGSLPIQVFKDSELNDGLGKTAILNKQAKNRNVIGNYQHLPNRNKEESMWL